MFKMWSLKCLNKDLQVKKKRHKHLIYYLEYNILFRTLVHLCIYLFLKSKILITKLFWKNYN
jgi:hypothetical protein